MVGWPTRCSRIGLPPTRKVKALPGDALALGIVIGLAARAEVTLFDEPYAGLDPVARQLFYDRLLADYAEHPRTGCGPPTYRRGGGLLEPGW